MSVRKSHGLYSAIAVQSVSVTKAFGSDLFDAVGLTDSAVIWAQPANSLMVGINMVLNAQFAATSLTDLDIWTGDAGDNDGLMVVAMNLTSDAVGTAYKTRGVYWNTATANSIYSQAGRSWTAYATAVGANLSTLTAGQITFYFQYIQL